MSTLIQASNKSKNALAAAALILISSTLTTACSAANEPTTIAPTEVPLADKMQTVTDQVNKLSGDLYCETDADCGFLPMGERACGGPSSYKIYSKKVGVEAVDKLKALSAESTALAKQANQKGGLLSTCEFYPLPAPSCVENQCAKSESPHLTY